LINESIQNLTKIGAEVGKITLEPLFRRILEGFNAMTKEIRMFGDISEFLGFNRDDAQKFGSDLAGNIMKSFGNILSGPGFVALGTILGKLFIDFTKFLGKAVVDFANLNKNASQQAALQKQVSAAYAANPALIDAITRKEMTRAEAERKILDALKQEIILREKINQLAGGAGARAMAQGYGASINKGSGEITTTYGGRGKSRGFVPNFSNMDELMGAMAGGYKPGDVRQTFIPREGMVTYNTAEKIKRFKGMEQAAIMPPEGSKAGKAYRETFEGRHGFDPYASGGFVPNLLNVLTSMRTVFDKRGSGSTGRMTDMLSASKEQLMKSQGVPAWLQGVLSSALNPGEMVRIKTMGQAAGVTSQERAGFSKGKGYAGHLKGGQMESALAGKAGNFSWKQRFAAPGGTGTLGKMPIDLGTKSKTGRNYPIESKPELKTKQIGQIFLKTLYENNSTSLRQLKTRLKQKADAGDALAGAHLDKLQTIVGRETLNRGKEIQKYTAGGVKSLSDFNAAVGFDSRNAIQGLRERQQGMNLFSGGFVPNFALNMRNFAVGYRTENGGPAQNRTFSAAVSQLNPTAKKNIAAMMGSKNVRGMTNKRLTLQAAVDPLRMGWSQVKKRAAEIGKTDKRWFGLRAGVGFEREIVGRDVPNNNFIDVLDTNKIKGGQKSKKLYDINKNVEELKLTEKAIHDANIISKVINQYRSKAHLQKMMASGGFVPNFSPISDAMATEEMMGGKGVLDFHPSVGVYVRDGKTQKNFGDVMRDHPEGMRKAMKNSRSMQDAFGASEGHVPNFATGMDLTMITASLGFLAMGAKDAVDGFKDAGAAAKKLEAELKEAAAGEDELRSKRKDSLQDEKAAKKEQRKLSSEQGKKQAEIDKEVTKKARKNLSGAAGPGGLKALKKGDRAAYDELLAEEKKRVWEQEKKATRGKIQKLEKEKATIDQKISENNKDVAEKKKNREQIKKEYRSSQKLSQEKIKEAAAHNKNSAMLGSTVRGVKGHSQQAIANAGGSGFGKRFDSVSNTMGKMAMPAMMMAPMLGGVGRSLADQGVFGDKKHAAAAIGGLETGLSFAAMGAMAGGPAGAAAGLAAGAGLGGMQYITEKNNQLPKLKETAERAAEALTKFNNSTQAYMTSLTSYSEGLLSETIKPQELAKRKEMMQQTFLDLPEDIRKKIASARGDTEKIQQIFGEIGRDMQRAAKRAKFAQSWEQGAQQGGRSTMNNAMRDSGAMGVWDQLTKGGAAGILDFVTYGKYGNYNPSAESVTASSGRKSMYGAGTGAAGQRRLSELTSGVISGLSAE